jgi:hypothetical protein
LLKEISFFHAIVFGMNFSIDKILKKKNLKAPIVVILGESKVIE